MNNRRTFLKKSAIAITALLIPGITMAKKISKKFKSNQPKHALVIWYSQAGNTERNGKLIAKTWKKLGLKVDASDYRKFNKDKIQNYDLIAIGSPVFYYDVPENFQDWIKSIPRIENIPVASFVTFGGEGGNQHNTACTLLELTADKGGIPVGMKTFSNMSTFSPTWSMGNEERVLKYKHLPDENTFKNVRKYASTIINNVNISKIHDIDNKLDYRNCFKSGPSIWGTKLLISNHSIDKTKCINCGTCVEKCPVNSIDLSTQTIDTEKCIACLGCINNCPAQAIKMTFMGKNVYGFNEFLKRNNIKINEPKF